MSLNFPAGASIPVSIINPPQSIANVRTDVFMSPTISTMPIMPPVPAFSFLLNHPTEGLYVFDLGIRADWRQNTPPGTLSMIERLNWTLTVDDDIPGVLEKTGVDLANVKGVIWSHSHFDHTGDPNRFPGSTDLIIGPGWQEKLVPNWPTVEDGKVDERAWESRNVREIQFDGEDIQNIAGLRAFDFFGDGSFYLLDAPGHAIGHMMGLARTTPTTFLLMGADTCHYAGHFRPSHFAPLPDTHMCPGEILEQIHPNPENATIEPFYTYPDVPDGQGVAFSREQALRTRESLMQLDADENVLTVIAHDETVARGKKIRFYPELANYWKFSEWKESVRWDFLKDLCTGSTCS